MTRRRVRLLALLCAPFALALLAWALHAPVLDAAARFLRVQDPLCRADAVYVLGGGNDSRPGAAAALYRAGWAPRVLLPAVEEDTLVRLGLVPSGTRVAAGVLSRLGVPASSVVVLPRGGGSTSTAQDAALLAAWVRANHARRVIVVTNGFHSRRARWLLRRALAGTGVELVMHPVPAPGVPERGWWRTEAGLLTYVDEYLKFGHNLVYR
ncbi:MAG: hypothetical protein JWM27_2455 [Gemmatimonadetes bacterium]|nr:hypothetical protein [Gemmatimonadota bacterium]